MSDYIKFYDEAPLWLRIVLSALGVPAFLYRLFNVIIEKAADTSRLIYLILNVVPIIGTVIYVIDIVWCALGRLLPRGFADWTNPVSVSATVDATPNEEPASEQPSDSDGNN